MKRQPRPDGRTARKVAAMRRVQDVAMALFRERGFDAVTVDEIARGAGVGVASVFRNFGTKENLVLWDEYDPLLFEGLASHLGKKRPLAALAAAVGEGLATFYDSERRRLLARTDLAMRTPAVAAASRGNVERFRRELARTLRRHVKDEFEREVLCAVFTTTLEVAVERWRRERARRSLATVLREALRHVARLG
jgi:AcrR family transcriptional regulator